MCRTAMLELAHAALCEWFLVDASWNWHSRIKRKKKNGAVSEATRIHCETSLATRA